MSIRYEAVHASGGDLEWLAPFEFVSDDKLEEGQYAIMLGGDEGVYVYGTVDELKGWRASIIRAHQQIIDHATKPLTFDDFEPDEDGNYPCPRCGGLFEVNDYDTLNGLIVAVTEHLDGHQVVKA